jgi:hypothetical protein
VVSGVVLSVDGPDVAQVDRFSLRDDTGTVLEFTVGVLDVANGGLPAPHLRDHLVSGDPITVWYSTSDDGLVALRYVDAAE